MTTTASPTWVTAKDLGTVADGSYFEKRLVATTPAGQIFYHVVSGELPQGISLSDQGLLYGIPTVVAEMSQEANYQNSFTVRARNQDDKIADRTFSLAIAGIAPPIIETTNSFLGVYYDGNYFLKQLHANDEEMSSNLSWRLIKGRLPPGITFNNTGLLEGFFYQNRVPDEAFSHLGWDKTAWDNYIYDYVKQEQDCLYEFTVELTDGISVSQQTYIIKVIAKDYMTSDNTQYTNDITTITADLTPRHLPFIVTKPQILPEIKPELSRQNTNFAFKFDAIGFDQGVPGWDYDIKFEITSLDEKGWDQYGNSDHVIDGGVIRNGPDAYGTGFDMDTFDSSDHPLPPYLGLDNDTGWYVGHLNRQTKHQLSYEFNIFARPDFVKDLKNYTGHKSKFGLTVLGQVDEVINWVTPEFLGRIDNGALSQFRIEATHNLGKPLKYYILGDGSRTPQGMILLSSGMISGRASFEYFEYDHDQTQIDGGNTTFDRHYEFTVRAQTDNQSAYSEKKFKIVVNYVNQKPFENLYLKGFPNIDQRNLFASIMNRQDIFPDQLIYRLNDPLYGKSKDLRFLFVPGINPADLPMYVEAMSQNHYTKTLLFGDLKTAVALDENYNIQYEVVYLEVIDEGEGHDPVTGESKSAAQVIDLSKNKNFYQVDGIEYRQLTPNGLGNMRLRIEEFIGYANKSTLPQWMSCAQPDTDNPGLYTSPLGYIRAVVLAYTVPGASKLIAYRLKNANFSFNRIEFKTDRYQLDNYLSKNYDLDLNNFIPGAETTIDYQPSQAEFYRNQGLVDYAVLSNFNDINGQTVTTIVNNGGLDGDTTFAQGNTIIFYNQNAFPINVPGWLDHVMNGNNNDRAAIYRINIIGGVVNLTIARSSQPGDIIEITKGTSFKGQTLYLEGYPKHGPAPHWWTFDGTLTSYPGSSDQVVKERHVTTFDQQGTRFFNYRDYYTDLDTPAKYIKFPKNGVFI